MKAWKWARQFEHVHTSRALCKIQLCPVHKRQDVARGGKDNVASCSQVWHVHGHTVNVSYIHVLVKERFCKPISPLPTLFPSCACFPVRQATCTPVSWRGEGGERMVLRGLLLLPTWRAEQQLTCSCSFLKAPREQLSPGMCKFHLLWATVRAATHYTHTHTHTHTGAGWRVEVALGYNSDAMHRWEASLGILWLYRKMTQNSTAPRHLHYVRIYSFYFVLIVER